MKKSSIEKKENGLYTQMSIKEKTPEDGFVYENKERIAESDQTHLRHSVWHKGYAKKISFTTNDPRITRPFVYTMCGIFLVLGIIFLLFHSWFFGISFTIVAFLIFYDAKKDIDAIEKDLKKHGHDMDSKEKKEEVRREYNQILKNTINDLTTSVFTHKNSKDFAKNTLPIYCIITLITSLFFIIAVNIVLGLFILLLFVGIGVFYYYIISKICKN